MLHSFKAWHLPVVGLFCLMALSLSYHAWASSRWLSLCGIRTASQAKTGTKYYAADFIDHAISRPYGEFAKAFAGDVATAANLIVQGIEQGESAEVMMWRSADFLRQRWHSRGMANVVPGRPFGAARDFPVFYSLGRRHGVWRGPRRVMNPLTPSLRKELVARFLAQENYFASAEGRQPNPQTVLDFVSAADQVRTSFYSPHEGGRPWEVGLILHLNPEDNPSQHYYILPAAPELARSVIKDACVRIDQLSGVEKPPEVVADAIARFSYAFHYSAPIAEGMPEIGAALMAGYFTAITKRKFRVALDFDYYGEMMLMSEASYVTHLHSYLMANLE